MKSRAQKEHEAQALAEAQPQPIAAFTNEEFAPAQVTVVAPDPGQQGPLQLKFFIGQLAPTLYVGCKSVTMDADTVISVCEHALAEARRVKTGLVVASAADLPQAG